MCPGETASGLINVVLWVAVLQFDGRYGSAEANILPRWLVLAAQPLATLTDIEVIGNSCPITIGILRWARCTCSPVFLSLLELR